MLNILIEFLKYKTFNKHNIYQESLTPHLKMDSPQKKFKSFLITVE